MRPYLVYVTVENKEEARAIGRNLVQSRLAACINIFDHMNSMYYWDDTLQDDQEAVLIAKTTEARVPELVEAIKEQHSYDCPCIVSFEIQDGNPAFLEWIETQVKR